jgi:hypothetical protein
LFFSLKTKQKYFLIFVNIKKSISTPTEITLSTVVLWSNFSKLTNEQFVCWPHTSTFRALFSVIMYFSISRMSVILSNLYHYNSYFLTFFVFDINCQSRTLFLHNFLLIICNLIKLNVKAISHFFSIFAFCFFTNDRIEKYLCN